jgi:hypothetical protein
MWIGIWTDGEPLYFSFPAADLIASSQTAAADR